MLKNKYDIVINGGGMVGLAMAVALADTHLSIAVIEKSDFSDLIKPKCLTKTAVSADEFKIRVSAISPGNQAFLSSLNVWQKIPESRIADYELMHVWNGSDPESNIKTDAGSTETDARVIFDAAKLAEPKLGSIVENETLRAALYDCASHFNNIDLIGDNQIESLHDLDHKIEITLHNKQVLSARLLIGADGAFSSVRQKMNIGVNEVAYRQIAYVANVKTEKPHQNTAWQRFTPYGPIAFLPLPQADLCSIVWSIDEDRADKLKNLSSQAFAQQLEQAFEHKLGKVTAISDYQGFPLIKRHAHSYLASRCVLIGDAAHTIHPLAGQGVNLGFQDVACLSQLIHQLVDKGRDFGLQANLRKYERESRVRNTIMQQSMSGFKWLFAQKNKSLATIRNWAMTQIDQSSVIKEIIIRKAMGI